MAGGYKREYFIFGRPQPIDYLTRPFQRFARFEAAGGVLLLLATAVALAWANSRWADGYLHLWHETRLTIGIGTFSLSKDLVHWINDLLMAVFFLLVGLEIKREMIVGELASPRRAAVPIVAAIGGMVLPAGLFALFTIGRPEFRGWGIPMATDIAFALGVIALLGARAPLSLKVFLASLAIIDDLGALLVIAIFYTEDISGSWLAIAAGILCILILLNFLGTRPWAPYVLIGAALWYALYRSGIHATIAGVLIAMTIPARAYVNADEFVQNARDMTGKFERGGESGRHIITNYPQQAALQALDVLTRHVQTPLQRLEHSLLPWVTFLIVPLFALANAGVGFALGAEPASLFPTAAQWGIAFGLIIGKPIGIFAATWLAVRTGLGTLPPDITWRHVLGLGFMAGIGFTMALFIAGLAYPEAQMLAEAKVAILGASFVAGIVGFALLWTARPAPEPSVPRPSVPRP